MSGRLGHMGVLPALAAAELAVTGAFSLFNLGSQLWAGEKTTEEIQRKLKEQRAAQIAEETQRRIALAQAEQQARQQALYASTSQRRTGQTVALFAVGVVAVGVSGYFIYKALKKRGG